MEALSLGNAGRSELPSDVVVRGVGPASAPMTEDNGALQFGQLRLLFGGRNWSIAKGERYLQPRLQQDAGFTLGQGARVWIRW